MYCRGNIWPGCFSERPLVCWGCIFGNVFICVVCIRKRCCVEVDCSSEEDPVGYVYYWLPWGNVRTVVQWQRGRVGEIYRRTKHPTGQGRRAFNPDVLEKCVPFLSSNVIARLLILCITLQLHESC